MLTSRRLSLALSGTCLSLVFAATALAAGPASVTVRIEGVTETKLPPTQVTTTTEPVVKDGNGEHACSGTSAIGALQLATGGNWSGSWSTSFHQYFIETIDGESEAVGSSKYFWSFWVNDKYQEEGACAIQLEAGNRVLFFPICYEGCPAGAEPTPLEVEAPAIANIGEPVSVAVKQYNAKAEPSPAAGASIAWTGASKTTDSQGHAALTFGGVGAYKLQVTGSESGPPSVRTETTICVHNGNDGNCGTQAPSSPATSTPSVASNTNGVAGSVTHYNGPFALVANATGLIDGHVYGRGQAPRILSGSILAHSTVSSVSLELRREYKRRCFAYDGASERFRRARCGHGRFFKVSANGTFSYLLPEGTSRLVFYVH
jgi:hypothetical protein